MSLFVKICGITDVTAAETCVQVGVDAVGFVFASSPRQLTPSQAAAIAEKIPESVTKVAVFRRPSSVDIESVLECFPADVVQADHDTITTVTDVDVLPVYREGEARDPAGTRFLYEGEVSGMALRVDLERAAKWAKSGEMVLAGGLTPDNVGDAIDVVRPFGVDVSSGVESSPGVKSPEKIRSFVRAVRIAEKKLVRT